MREDAFDMLGLVRATVLAKPERLDPASAWLGHTPFAFWLIDATRPAYLVELGTHYGQSYFAMCQAVKGLGLTCRCYAVDTWVGDEQTGFYGPEVFHTVVEHNDGHYSDFSTLLRMPFDDALSVFEANSVDLLHIDGYHSFEEAEHDFTSWLPKMSERGVVMFHDIAVRAPGFGVFRLWEEVKASYPTFEFAHGHGLGIAGVGGRQPPKMTALFDLDVGERDVLAQFFLTLAEGWVARYEERRLATMLEEVTRMLGASRSWRITKPLRAVADAARRIRRGERRSERGTPESFVSARHSFDAGMRGLENGVDSAETKGGEEGRLDQGPEVGDSRR